MPHLEQTHPVVLLTFSHGQNLPPLAALCTARFVALLLLPTTHCFFMFPDGLWRCRDHHHIQSYHLDIKEGQWDLPCEKLLQVKGQN